MEEKLKTIKTPDKSSRMDRINEWSEALDKKQSISLDGEVDLAQNSPPRLRICKHTSGQEDRT